MLPDVQKKSHNKSPAHTARRAYTALLFYSRQKFVCFDTYGSGGVSQSNNN